MQQRTVQILTYALLAALLTWGVYAVIAYIGAPLHSAVLAPDDALAAVDAACGDKNLFCRGLQTLLPFLVFTVTRAAPFLWYAVLSLVAYGVFVGWKAAQSGSGRFSLRIRPWHVFVWFLISLWAVFLALSHLSTAELPVRKMVEPRPEVYASVSAETLKVLKENFDELKNSDCLSSEVEMLGNVPVYTMKGTCVQTAFVTRVLSQVLIAIIFLFELLLAGHTVLMLLRLRPRSLLLEGMLSVGIGVYVWIFALWLLAISSLFTANAGWLLVIAVPITCFRSVLYWAERFWRHEWEVHLRWSSPLILLAWLLISYLAFNFLTVVRPFPIGWDDLGSYLNRPRLLVSYGTFIHSMATFQWEYLTALGFLLFGFANPFAATASMIINWTEGLLAVLTVYLFTNQFLGRGRGILAALLYYSLPLVGHFSFADMKIDNAVFTMAALGLLALFLFLFPTAEEADQEGTDPPCPDLRLLLLSGLFISVAFAMKSTAIMTLMALAAILVAARLHWTAFISMSVLIFVLFALQGVLGVGDVARRLFGAEADLSRTTFVVTAVIIALIPAMYAAFRGRERLLSTFLYGGIIGACFLAFNFPWILYNNIQNGTGTLRLEMGAPNRFTPAISLRGKADVNDKGQDIRVLPPELAVNPDHPLCKASGAKEELDRYWGFRVGWTHYLTLPWRTVMNLDSGGYYVTTAAALLLFPLLLLLPYFWTRKGRWMRSLFGATILILLEWMFLANGIPWYGVGVFLGLAIGLEVLVARAPDILSKITVSILITLSLMASFAMRFWQFDQQQNLIEYPMGKISARALSQRTIPWYEPIQQIVVERHEKIPNRPYLYRIGTFIPYFIPKNLETIGVTDHQLDFFNCLYQDRNPELMLKRLKTLGFNSIIFDTNTATIERDEQGSLHKKVQTFLDFVNTPSLGLQVLVNDPGSGVAFLLIP
ncbi:MAG: Uncharacterized protein Greene041619_30 [Candidatus Peregrinibacteria bacterium Greene0416_19]|nr:MAG: Uncharacterized protein Greene041619_30 [Candidatus Peregrinibacteria bacterium Greene0416_19]